MYKVGEAITPLVLPLPTTGGGYSLSLSPSLPAGLSRSFRTISGTPTAPKQETTYRWFASIIGDNDEITFNITVKEPPTFSGATVPEQIWTEGVRIPTLRFPNATGGNGTLTYFLSPAQPVGISRQDNRLFGTPTEPQRRSLYTWTVRDEDNDEDIIEFYITVRDKDDVPSFGSETVEDQSYVNGSSVTLTLPQATGGNGTLNYSITPALPSGLNFNSNTREITGTPDTPTSRRTYTYKVTDSDSDTDDGDSDSITFSITIEANQEPSFGGQSILYKTLVSGTTLLLPFRMRAATGGNGGLTYSLTPSLPTGLEFDPATRNVSGIPTTASSNREYTYTVTDDDGDSDERTFNITVRPAEPNTEPTFGSETIDNKVYINGEAVNETLPEATSGNAPLTYSLTNTGDTQLTLHKGLDYTDRVISGTPRSASTGTYTYTATDRNGNTDTLDFMLSVEVPSAPGPTTRRPGTSGTESGGGGGGCAVSDQSSTAPDILGAVACLILIPVSVAIRRKRRT